MNKLKNCISFIVDCATVEAVWALIALEADWAQLEVPNKLPTNEPENEPLLYEEVKLLNDEVVTNDEVSKVMLLMRVSNEALSV